MSAKFAQIRRREALGHRTLAGVARGQQVNAGGDIELYWRELEARLLGFTCADRASVDP